MFDAYRICNGIADGLDGITIDKYAAHYQIQFFNEKMLKYEQTLVEMVKKRFSPEFIAVKYRFEDRSQIKAVFGSNSKTIVEENGCKFAVDLLDTLNPGLFLDMRDARQMFGKMCKGKDVLNLFAYTCSFGVYAKKNGASRVVNVDISKKILNRGKENFALNDLEGEFFCGSAEEYVNWAVKKGKKFGAIVIDPPSFAKNGKKTFSVAKDFEPLAAKCRDISDGVVLLATNYSPWCGGNALQEMAANIGCKVLKSGAQGKDFPGLPAMVWVLANFSKLHL
ncbi:MAG: class I SAM-dependent methyltransferase [Fibromonadales bacterium]|nr:class I SAM-dependent methyltransferase [Fibromonadales bacterium]